MPYGRCPEEVDYQARFQRLLKRIQSVHYFPNAGHHSFLELDVSEPPFHNLYWLRRSRWGADVATEAHIRSSLGYFYCWYDLNVHVHTARNHVRFYIPIFLRCNAYSGSWNLLIPTPPLFSYDMAELLGSGSVSHCVLQIVYAKWALFALIAFLHAVICGVLLFSRDRDARFYEVDDQPVPGRLLPLSTELVELVHNMGMQNIRRSSRIHHVHAERALLQSLETNWSWTPGFLWYDFDTAMFPTMSVSGNAVAVPRRERLPNHRPEWKEVYVDNLFPSGNMRRTCDRANLYLVVLITFVAV